ncbi:MAG TPA: hypothetical protein VG406_27045 [Isosphaeraceae bacterium]|jgi:hypothetical protein|nr:hypothetical protein [Isosphaeraceae bacterium]
MLRPPFAAMFTAFVLATASAQADPPKINGTTPYGVRRGEATELTIQGGSLEANPELVAPFAFQAEPAGKSDGGNWRLKVTVAPETPLGVYPIRVKTDGGLSNLMLLAVGQVPQVAEKEENGSFEAAQAIEMPVVVEGQVPGSDVDCFKFRGKKGRRIVVDAACSRIGSGVDPTLRLSTAGRSFVAASEDAPGLQSDARLVATLPEDGDYVIELSDTKYQGAGRPIYRLTVGALPVADEVFPLGGRRGETLGLEFRGGTLPDGLVAVGAVRLAAPIGATTIPWRVTNQNLGLIAPGEPLYDVEPIGPLAVGDWPESLESADPNATPTRAIAPAVLNGRIDPERDEDRFVVVVEPGKSYRVHVVAAALGSALDAQLQVLGAKGAVLANGDDTNTPPLAQGLAATTSPDPTVNVNVPGDLREITVVVRDLTGRGGVGYPYRIVVEPSEPGFDLVLNDPQVSIPKGGTVAVGVIVARRGYNGPIALRLDGAPAGLTTRALPIADGQNNGLMTISATPEVSFGAVTLDLVGEGKGPAGPILGKSSKTLILAQQGNIPTATWHQDGLAAALATAGPVAVDSPDAPIVVAQGTGSPLPLKLRRAGGADSAVDVAIVGQVPGLGLADNKLAEKAAEGHVTVNAALDAPLGTRALPLTAKGKFANADRTVTLPLVTVDVVRPAELSLATPNVEVKAGESVELKGKVERRGTFKEPVTVRLDGLPGGLKAEPVTVAPDAAEFALKLAADPAAAAATAKAKVLLAAKLGGKDYNAPPVEAGVKVVPK